MSVRRPLAAADLAWMRQWRAACDPATYAANRTRMLRLAWSDAMPGLGSEAASRLKAALDAGPDQVVLAGVDRPAAIAWGWEMGITLFQGRLVEQRRPVL